MKKTVKPNIKKLPYIDYMCKVGERVFWENLRKERFEGVIKEWNDNVATVQMDDGTEKIIVC